MDAIKVLNVCLLLLSISVFHDDSKVPLDVLGFKGGFLGEVKISMKDIDFTRPHNAW